MANFFPAISTSSNSCIKIQCFLWIILVPSPRLISLSIPLLLPLLRRALKQLGTNKSLHIIAFLHFSVLWVLIKLDNQGKPAYLKQPIRSPHPAVSSTYQPHSIKLSVSEGDLISPFPSPELIRFLYSAGLYLAHSSSLWLILWEATNNQRSVQRLSSWVNN